MNQEILCSKRHAETGATQVEYTIITVILVLSLLAVGGFLKVTSENRGNKAIAGSKDGIPENSYLTGDMAK